MTSFPLYIVALVLSISLSTNAWDLHRIASRVGKATAAAVAAASLAAPLASHALEQQYKLPPIDRKDTGRCQLTTSNMGQANAARDKLYDVRECDLKGQTGAGKDMSGLIADSTDFTSVDFKEAQLSKAYIKDSKMSGCDFTNGIVDRATFVGTDLSKSVFANAVLSGTSFKESNLKDTDFTDAYLGPFDLKNLCLNPTLAGTNPTTKVDTRESAGCAEL